MNPNNETIPSWRMRPKLIEFYDSTNIVLDRFTARNSPVWNVHSFLSKNIAMTNLTVLAPRSVGNTDGLDPDSCENVLMDSCYIDVGDDGVSIKVCEKVVRRKERVQQFDRNRDIFTHTILLRLFHIRVGYRNRVRTIPV